MRQHSLGRIAATVLPITASISMRGLQAQSPHRWNRGAPTSFSLSHFVCAEKDGVSLCVFSTPSQQETTPIQ